jgi:hypothetical protein
MEHQDQLLEDILQVEGGDGADTARRTRWSRWRWKWWNLLKFGLGMEQLIQVVVVVDLFGASGGSGIVVIRYKFQ